MCELPSTEQRKWSDPRNCSEMVYDRFEVMLLMEPERDVFSFSHTAAVEVETAETDSFWNEMLEVGYSIQSTSTVAVAINHAVVLVVASVMCYWEEEWGL